MNRRIVLFVAAVTIVALGAGAAFATITSINIASSRAKVTYPEGAKLRFKMAYDTTPSVPPTVTVQYRPAGQNAWLDYKARTVDATRSAANTLSVELCGPQVLSGTSAFKLVSQGAESNVVTVSVAARLKIDGAGAIPGHKSDCRARSKQHKDRGSKAAKGDTLYVKGLIMPKHEKGAVVRLQFFKATPAFVKWHGHKILRYDWATTPSMTATATVGDAGQRWSAMVPLSDGMKGIWKVKASHEDTAHVLSKIEQLFVIK